MKLMRYTPTDWLDVVAMRVEGAVSNWMNVGPARYIRGSQASVLHVGPIQAVNGAAIRASH